MKDVFHSSGFRALVVVIFALFCLMLMTAGGGHSALSSALGFLSTPMQRISTLVTNNAADTAGNVTTSKGELAAENDRLKKQVDELNKKLINYYTYQQENAQLRKFLGLKSKNQDFKPVSAAVVGSDPNDLFSQFTIDEGPQSGIAVNDPVITESGVVGWVSSISPSYSKVTTILSPDTKIGAVDKVNRESGVVGCDVKLADQGIVRLNYLSAGTTVKKGDIVVTSGIGGVYPRDLPVGTVKKVDSDPYDVALHADITPFVKIKNVRDVMVITSFEGQGQALSSMNSSSSGGK